jgi:hypothetical protein
MVLIVSFFGSNKNGTRGSPRSAAPGLTLVFTHSLVAGPAQRKVLHGFTATAHRSRNPSDAMIARFRKN